MTPSRITISTDNRLCRITLNRPEKRNALDDIMVSELTDAFASAANDQAVKVIMLSGSGSAFCAGADLGYLQRIALFDIEQNKEDSARLAGLFETIALLPKPVVALVNGPALAGGCGLASVCDIVIASEERAQFGYPEVRIGFIPAVVMTFLVRRVGEGKARELVLRGNIISASEAKEINLVNLVTGEESLESDAESLCRELITQNSGVAMALSKQLFRKIAGLDLHSALHLAAGANAEARMTPECKKGIESFLAKKNIEW